MTGQPTAFDLGQGVPQPPFDAVMPAAQYPVTIVFGLLALSAALFAIVAARTTRSAIPLAIFLGSALSMVCEPIVTMLGHCFYPPVGQLTLFTAQGRTIPLFVGFAYCFYFAPGIVFLVDRFGNGMTVRGYRVLVGTLGLFVIGYDYLGISLGLWRYYGDTPLTIARFPIWWVPANLLVFVPAATTIHLARDWLVGSRQWLLVPFMAAQVLMFHALGSLPAYTVLNMDVSSGWKLAGVLASMLISATILDICGRLVCRGAPS
ncbi:hypothetical protein [Novosphingobium lentum]|uniref:hypothetical protein n=1 Tax=Novosphingobium lentum TaxID=145287 RepID=UPI0008310497|nr:hypothetical protein [Novosphingobium lentum]